MVKYIQIIPVNTNTVNTYNRIRSTIFGFPLSVFSIQITSVNTNTYHSNIDNTKMDVASITFHFVLRFTTCYSPIRYIYAETRIIQTRLIRRYGSWIVISVYYIYFRLGILKKNLTILRIIRTPDKEYISRGSTVHCITC